MSSGFAASGLFLCACIGCLVCWAGKNDRQRGTSRMWGTRLERVDLWTNPKEGPYCPSNFPHHEAAFRNDSRQPAAEMGAGSVQCFGNAGSAASAPMQGLTFTIGGGARSRPQQGWTRVATDQ